MVRAERANSISPVIAPAGAAAVGGDAEVCRRTTPVTRAVPLALIEKENTEQGIAYASEVT